MACIRLLAKCSHISFCYGQIIREIILCRQFHHPNILPFLGATFHQQSRLCGLVTPYMKNGNLLSFLESNPSIERLTPVRVFDYYLVNMY